MPTVTKSAYNSTLVDFESPAALAVYCRTFTYTEHASVTSDSSWRKWTGRTWHENILEAERGDTQLVPMAERLIEQLECHVEAPRSSWERSRAGAYPMVPEFLAGHPDSMRRRVEASDDRSPLRVVVDLTASAGISIGDFAKRGTAYLALAMFLANERPVTLEVVGTVSSNAVFVRVPIAAQPLDLAVAAHVLTSAGFYRGLIHEACYKNGASNPRWPWDLIPIGDGPQKVEYVKRMRELLGLEKNDIFGPPVYLTDPAVKDPVGFVRRSIEEHSRLRDE
jgi:hypothetical protein